MVALPRKIKKINVFFVIQKKKAHVEHVLNYFYFEFLQMLLSALAWKGILVFV